MKTAQPLLARVLGLLLISALAISANAASPSKTRVLLIVGGHAFHTNQFYEVFNQNTNITWRVAEHPNAHALLKAEAARDWDVLVLYDYWQKITEESKADLLARLHEGKGLVSLHHAIADYQNWPEYANIIGARYYTSKTNINGVEKLRSQFKHDVDLAVQVVDPKNPVTRGVAKDFTIHDETYKLFDVQPDVKLLLSTTNTNSEPKLCWAKKYDKARVVYLQLGHDRFAYGNPNFQRVLAQAIQWTNRK